MNLTLKAARRVVVAVFGATLLLIGIAMLVLPGPGLLLIAMGLGALSSEFVWARRWLARLKQTAERNNPLRTERDGTEPADSGTR